MSAIAWLTREETVALGWTLLHFCWQGTAVAVAYAVVDQVTSRATSEGSVCRGTRGADVDAGSGHRHFRRGDASSNSHTRQMDTATPDRLRNWHPVANPRPVLHEIAVGLES